MIDRVRIVHIMKRLYDCNAEIVIEFATHDCYLFQGSKIPTIPVTIDELECLELNKIIECDGGVSGDIQESSPARTYRLTEMAIARIAAILREPKTLMLNA